MAIHSMEVRFEGDLLATHTDSRGLTYRLFKYRGEEGEEYYVIHHDDPDGEAFLETGRGEGIPEGLVRHLWPELAEAAGLEQES